MSNALNRLEPSYYRVEIDVASLTPGGADETLGGIDNLTPEEHGKAENSGAFPTTLDKSLEKERANMRYQEVLRQASFEIQPVLVTAFDSDADNDNPPSQFDFTLSYDKPEYLRTEDEFNAGVFLTGADAVKRYVERGLTATIVQNRAIFDPDNVNPPNSVPNNANQMIEVTAESADGAFAAPMGEVVVTEIADLTE